MSDQERGESGKESLTLAVMSDIHVRETDRGRWRGLFREISGTAEVLAICGDLTDRGLPGEAQLLAEELEACSIPVVGVLGNHDHDGGLVSEIRRILFPRFQFLEEGPCTIGGVGFAGVKGFCGGFDRWMLGPFGEEAVKTFVGETMNDARTLDSQLHSLEAARRTVVILHYAPIAATVKGEPPELYPVLGSSLFARVIDRHDVAAAFHGHAHYGTFAGKTPGGVPVYNCSYEIMRKRDSRRPYFLMTL